MTTLLDGPITSYLADITNDTDLADWPVTSFGTTFTTVSTGMVAEGLPFAIIAHNDDEFIYHDGSNISFHNYYHADVGSTAEYPRITYLGEV